MMQVRFGTVLGPVFQSHPNPNKRDLLNLKRVGEETQKRHESPDGDFLVVSLVQQSNGYEEKPSTQPQYYVFGENAQKLKQWLNTQAERQSRPLRGG